MDQVHALRDYDTCSCAGAAWLWLRWGGHCSKCSSSSLLLLSLLLTDYWEVKELLLASQSLRLIWNIMVTIFLQILLSCLSLVMHRYPISEVGLLMHVRWRLIVVRDQCAHFLQVIILEAGELGPKSLYQTSIAVFFYWVVFKSDLREYRHIWQIRKAIDLIIW